jgi:hypothetical protein
MEETKQTMTETKPAIADRPKYILLEKTKSLHSFMHHIIDKFPKSQKFSLCQRIEDTLLEMIKLLIFQNYQQTDEDRKRIMLNFLADSFLLDVLLSQSADFKYISFEEEHNCKTLLNEITNFASSRHTNLGGKK